jgi:H+/Cl- antiporter ClcA
MPAHSKEHVMRNWWIPAICAGGGGLIGVAAGDWFSVSHTIGMVLAGAGAAIGAVFGAVLAQRRSGLN